MRRVPAGFVLAVLVLLLVASSTANAQQTRPQTNPQTAPDTKEMKAEVPELWEFHNVIARMWHGAWPKKDFDAMAALLPEIESGAARVKEASLPGILRDKEADWDAGVDDMMVSVAAYRKGVQKKELKATLDAGEELHTRFERLVRLIRPALKELDQFHQALYKLYHYDLPDYDLEGIRASAKAMSERVGPLQKAKLPGRVQNREWDFREKTRALGKAVEALVAAAGPGADRAAVEKAVEKVHDRYQAVEGLF